MTTVLLFLSHFITKLPPDTTVLRTFPARNNCSPDFLEYRGVCFSTTHFSLCIIQENHWGRICESYLRPSFLLKESLELMWWDAIKIEKRKAKWNSACLHCTTLAASTLWCRHFLRQSSHPSSHMCLFAMGLTNPFCDPIHTFGLPNILWWRVPQFKHALHREGLPSLCYKPTDWYFHWVSLTVRSQWTVIPWLSFLYHSILFF